MRPDRQEILLWTLLRRFETDTLQRYGEHVPDLVTPQKRRLLERLGAEASDEVLDASELAGPLRDVLHAARSENAEQTIFVRGFVLELLGRNIYAAAAAARGLSNGSRELAELGRRACEDVARAASRCAERQVGTGDVAFVAFADASHDVLGALDAIGDPVDRIFGKRMQTCYAELMGEFAADLLEACVALGMQRRKVVGHLAAASMGF